MTTSHRAHRRLPLLQAWLLGLVLLAGTTGSVAQPLPPQQLPESAQSALPPEIAAGLNKMTAALAEAEKGLEHASGFEDGLAGLRTKVEGVLDQTEKTAEKLRPQLKAVKSQIEKLGPAPAKDSPPEAPEVAGERARLTALASALDGAVKSSEVTWVRARQLIERITVLRHSLFTKNLMERLPSPLLPSVWRDFSSAVPGAQQRFAFYASDWWHRASQNRSALALLLVAALLVYAILKVVAWKTTDRHSLRVEGTPPTFFERAISAAWTAPIRALPAVASAILVYAGLDLLGLLFNPWDQPAASIVKGIFVFAAVSALLSATMAPAEPQWRLVSLANRPVRRIARLLAAMTAVYAIDGALTEVARAFFLPLPLTIAQSFIMSSAFAGLLIALLLTPFVPHGAPLAGYSRHTPRWLKLPLWVIALGTAAAALSGYVALARFASEQLILTGIVVLLVWLGCLAIRALTREPPQHGLPVTDLLEQRFGMDAPRRHQLARLTELALTFGLVVCALPFLMLQWGFSGADIRDWLKSLLYGFEIGQFRISPVRILGGVLLFVALLFATRLFQRFLRERSAQSRMDPASPIQ